MANISENSTLYEISTFVEYIKGIDKAQLCPQHAKDLTLGMTATSQLALKQRAEHVLIFFVQLLELYERVYKNLSFNYQVEKLVPTIIMHAVAALDYQPKNIPDYHRKMLITVGGIMFGAKSSTVSRLALSDPEIVACVWLPIDFVGDFNTQMMALHLVLKLLKCLKFKKRQEILLTFRSNNVGALREIFNDVMAEVHTEWSLEIACRKILNYYNILENGCSQIYSLTCLSLTFGENIQFTKQKHFEEFWLDFNYRWETLTFNGHFINENNEEFSPLVNVTVEIREVKLDLNIPSNLIVFFKRPAQLSIELPNINMQSLYLEIQLSSLETERLMNNKLFSRTILKTSFPECIITNYNNSAWQALTMPVISTACRPRSFFSMEEHTSNNCIDS